MITPLRIKIDCPIWFQDRLQPIQDNRITPNCWRVTELLMSDGQLWCGLENVHTGEQHEQWRRDVEIVGIG